MSTWPSIVSLRLLSPSQSWVGVRQKRSDGQTTASPYSQAHSLGGSFTFRLLLAETKAGLSVPGFSRENSTAINPVTPAVVTPDAGIPDSC